MTSLAPGNALLKKDKVESSPAKRSLSRKEKRKRIKKTDRQNYLEGAFGKRPNTSYLLQTAMAEKMPWPKNPEGRSKISHLIPVKAFNFKSEKESQFLHSEKDFKMTIENFPEELGLASPHNDSRIDEMEEFERDDEDYYKKIEVTSMYSVTSKDKVHGKRETTRKPKAPTISDVIKLLQNEPKETGQYYYLDQPEGNGPYDLQPQLELEDHTKLNPKKFYTLSSKGITTYLNNEPVEFITLNDWLADKDNYNRIRKKTFFQKFDRWKILRLWKIKINVNKRKSVSKKLENKLFILRNHFRNVILELKNSC